MTRDPSTRSSPALLAAPAPGAEGASCRPPKATSSSSSTPRRRRRRSANFLQYVKAGHYNGTVFHRVIDGFMIQGGGYDADMKQKPDRRAPIPLEARNGLTNVRGTVAMARTNDPNSATSQFFINVERQRLPRPGQLARRQRLRRVRQGGRRHGRRRQDPRRCPPAATACTRTCPSSRSSSRKAIVEKCKHDQVVNCTTSAGDIRIELDDEKAPPAVANFLAYVRKGHYDGTVFHRVIKGFMIQGGGFEPGMKQKPTDAPIQNEANNGLKNDHYTLAMARTTAPHSATRAVLHQHRRTTASSTSSREIAAGLGLCRVRQGRRRHGRGRRDREGQDRPQGHARRRAGGRRA